MLFTERGGTRAAFAKDPAVVKLGESYFLYFSSYYQGSGDGGKSWYLLKCNVGFRDGIPYVKKGE